MKQDKKLGQIFVNPNIIEKELDLVDINNKVILEIGAGDGRLTKLLVKNAKKIISIEKDKTYCNILKKEFNKNKNTFILCGDFLKFPPRKVDIIIGNVPYYISSDILLHLKNFKFDTSVLMFQKEFVQKLISKEGTPEYGFISVISQTYFNIEKKFLVKKTNFYPIPKVDSVVIIMKKTTNKLDEEVEQIIRILFNHKKKTLKNALKDSYTSFNISKKIVSEFVDTLEISNKRVFNLPKEEIIDISKKVCKWKKRYSLIGEKKKENC